MQHSKYIQELFFSSHETPNKRYLGVVYIPVLTSSEYTENSIGGKFYVQGGTKRPIMPEVNRFQICG